MFGKFCDIYILIIMYLDFCAGEANKAVHLVIAEGLEAYLPLADMVDIGEEVERLRKQATKLQADFDSSMKRLSSSKVRKQYESFESFRSTMFILHKCFLILFFTKYYQFSKF